MKRGKEDEKADFCGTLLCIDGLRLRAGRGRHGFERRFTQRNPDRTRKRLTDIFHPKPEGLKVTRQSVIPWDDAGERVVRFCRTGKRVGRSNYHLTTHGSSPATRRRKNWRAGMCLRSTARFGKRAERCSRANGWCSSRERMKSERGFNICETRETTEENGVARRAGRVCRKDSAGEELLRVRLDARIVSRSEGIYGKG